MPDAAFAHEVAVWTDARHAATVGRVLERMGSAVRAIAVGGSRSAEVATLARGLGCGVEDDFRRMLVDRPAAFLLLATMEGIGRDAIAAALASGTRVIALEPLFAGLQDLSPVTPRPPGAAGIHHVPAFPRGAVWRTVGDPLELVGTPRLLSFVSFGPAAERSLFARLFEAWDTLLTLAPMPETIDASLVGPLTAVPEGPEAVTGFLAAHARIDRGCSAVLEVSDLAAPARRRLSVVGTEGQVRIDDAGYESFDAAGSPGEKRSLDAPTDFAALAAEDWTRLLRGPAPDAPAPAIDRVLSCCLATLLSARTGDPESPQKLREIQLR